jgi:hypothetical protein
MNDEPGQKDRAFFIENIETGAEYGKTNGSNCRAASERVLATRFLRNYACSPRRNIGFSIPRLPDLLCLLHLTRLNLDIHIHQRNGGGRYSGYAASLA